MEQFKKRLEKLLSDSILLWRLLKLLFKILHSPFGLSFVASHLPTSSVRLWVYLQTLLPSSVELPRNYRSLFLWKLFGPPNPRAAIECFLNTNIDSTHKVRISSNSCQWFFYSISPQPTAKKIPSPKNHHNEKNLILIPSLGDFLCYESCCYKIVIIHSDYSLRKFIARFFFIWGVYFLAARGRFRKRHWDPIA